MAYAIVHHFPGGTKDSTRRRFPPYTPTWPNAAGRADLHAAGPSEDGWTITAVHESQESWERFRDNTLMPTMQAGIAGGFETPPTETAFPVENLQQAPQPV